MAIDKVSFRKVGVTLYEGVAKSGIKYVLAPIAGLKTKVFGVMVGKGGLDDVERIGNTRIPAGSAHLLEHRMFQMAQGDGAQLLLAQGASSNAFTDRSSTFYYFSTVDDWKAPLNTLWDMVTHFYMSEERVEREKDIVIGELEGLLDNPAYLFQKEVSQALYSVSPLKDLIIGTPETIKQIHMSTLKKFFLAFYGLKDMVLFGTGGFDPEEVVKELDGQKPVNDFTMLETYRVDSSKEDHASVRQGFVKAPSPDGQTYLGVGIKFPTRKELFDKYGDSIFTIYELLPELVFSPILAPIDRMKKDGLAIFEAGSSLEEGGEDAFLDILYETNSPAKLKERLEEHLAKPQNALDPFFGELRSLKSDYFGDALAVAGAPFPLIDSLVDSFQNHFAWPALAESVLSVNRHDAEKFLKDLSGWPRSYVLLTGKEGKR